MKSRLGPRLVVHMYFFEFRKLLQYFIGVIYAPH